MAARYTSRRKALARIYIYIHVSVLPPPGGQRSTPLLRYGRKIREIAKEREERVRHTRTNAAWLSCARMQRTRMNGNEKMRRR